MVGSNEILPDTWSHSPDLRISELLRLDLMVRSHLRIRRLSHPRHSPFWRLRAWWRQTPTAYLAVGRGKIQNFSYVSTRPPSSTHARGGYLTTCNFELSFSQHLVPSILVVLMSSQRSRGFAGEATYQFMCRQMPLLLGNVCPSIPLTHGGCG